MIIMASWDTGPQLPRGTALPTGGPFVSMQTGSLAFHRALLGLPLTFGAAVGTFPLGGAGQRFHRNTGIYSP